ncbi:MAG: hypothetical protein GY774_37985 [Planctomycetes bacterium]|nr:hypothetical protein [Planctomycetota bacterium]
MASRKKKTWVYSPPRKPKPKVPDEIKQELQEKGNEIVEKLLKPEYLKPVPEQQTLNHLIDIYTKWYRNYFYFCSTYKCPPEAYASFFENKFARLEYLGNNKFELSYMRHTGQWWRLETGTMDDCLESISTMVPY